MMARTLSAAAALFAAAELCAAPILIVNAGFEDDYQGSDVSPGTFPTGPAPNGWSIWDPSNVVGSGSFVGVLNPGTLAANGTTFFPDGAAEGDNALLLYSNGDSGGAEYGVEQVLSTDLAANVLYTLSVAVGNIASGTGLPPFDGLGFYNLDGFPGYRIELLAGGVVLAADDNGLTGISEGAFLTSTLQFSTTVGHAQVGSPLSIRLVNLHDSDVAGVRGLEVDFDDVRLDASPVPAPAPLWLIGGLGLAMFASRRRA